MTKKDDKAVSAAAKAMRARVKPESLSAAGKAGGTARAAKLSKKRRREIASAAVKARWDKYRADQAENTA